MRIFHDNIYEVDTIEGIGRSVLRTCASLDNKKKNHQYYMIEVESKIYNQLIAILIDSRASHSYIHPNLVGICHLKRRKHGKT